MSKFVKQLSEILDDKELLELNSINAIIDSEQRQYRLKNFFTSPLIFNKVKHIIDPSWLSYEIFINGKGYEF
jgi:hypothetical protein